MKTVILSDIHGNLASIPYLGPETNVLQLGDLSMGFSGLSGKTEFHPNFFFFPGNHDNPRECEKSKHFLGRFGALPWNKEVFFIGGARSIDKAYRIEGVSWWPEEELSTKEQMECLDLLEKRKDEIKVIVSHDCPSFVFRAMKGKNLDKPSSTNRLLDHIAAMYGARIERWIFGHHHMSFIKTIDDTKYVCLEIGETYDLD